MSKVRWIALAAVAIATLIGLALVTLVGGAEESEARPSWSVTGMCENGDRVYVVYHSGAHGSGPVVGITAIAKGCEAKVP